MTLVKGRSNAEQRQQKVPEGTPLLSKAWLYYYFYLSVIFYYWSRCATLESPLDSKIKPVNLKGNQFWIFMGRTSAEVEAPILWPPDAKNWLLRKDPDAGKDGRQENGTTKDEMVGWHHWLDGHEYEQAPGDGDGQGGLVCCSPWGFEESDMT